MIFRSITGSWDGDDEATDLQPSQRTGIGSTRRRLGRAQAGAAPTALPPAEHPTSSSDATGGGLLSGALSTIPSILKSITGSRDGEDELLATYFGRPIVGAAGGGIFLFW